MMPTAQEFNGDEEQGGVGLARVEEAEQSVIVQRVKSASGAFYDSGAQGADQTVEACAASVSSVTVADPSSKPKPASSRGGGRRLVKKQGMTTSDAADAS